MCNKFVSIPKHVRFQILQRHLDPTLFGYQKKLNLLCFQDIKQKRVIWILDSECSRQMTIDRTLLSKQDNMNLSQANFVKMT